MILRNCFLSIYEVPGTEPILCTQHLVALTIFRVFIIYYYNFAYKVIEVGPMLKICQKCSSYSWPIPKDSKFCVQNQWTTPLPNLLYSSPLQPVYDLLSWSWHCPLSNVTKDLPVLFMSNKTQSSFSGRCWALCQNNGPDRNHLPILLHLDSRWWTKRAWKL